MAWARLYLDEDVHAGVARGLRRRGYDVLTTTEAAQSGATDADQLRFAVSEQRCLFTFNRGDFARLHAESIDRGDHHFGIVVSRQIPVGAAVRRLAALLAQHAVDDLKDRLVWFKTGTV